MSHSVAGLTHEHNKHRSSVPAEEFATNNSPSNNSRAKTFNNLNTVEQNGDNSEVADFVLLNETRQEINRVIATIYDASFDKRVSNVLAQYECAIREEFQAAYTSPPMCRKLARRLSGLNHLIFTIARARPFLSSVEYRQRMCHNVAYYIACELCAAQVPVEPLSTIISRIQSALLLHIEKADSSAGSHKEYLLRTLCAIPKLFNREEILKMLYSRLLPQWSSHNTIIQAELPDKIYIQYIIIFYCWLNMESDNEVREQLLCFADKFMRPAPTLASNATYAQYLPEVITRTTATRCILEELRQQKYRGYFSELRTASKVDNKVPQSSVVDLTGDADDASGHASMPLEVFYTEEPAPATVDPPEFLHNLVSNARPQEPCKRAEALFSRIDKSKEIIEVRDSDDDVEMFSVDFNVSANVDGNTSSDGPNITPSTEDDSVPITRIYPSNLRTYQRVTSSGQKELSAAPSYTVPRIVNSYSCRLDSRDIVTTSSPGPPTLVDQFVQTADSVSEFPVSEEVQCTHTGMPASHSSASHTSRNELLYRAPFYAHSSQTMLQIQESSHISTLNCPSNSPHSSDTSLNKKQVSFSAHLDAYKPMPTPSDKIASRSQVNRPMTQHQRKRQGPGNPIESLRLQGRNEHLQASDRMFAKYDFCDSSTPKLLKSKTSATTPFHATPTFTSTPTARTLTTLTPTTSNKSSNTSTSTQLKLSLLQPKKQEKKRSLAATRSVLLHVHRASTDTLTSVDMEELEKTSKKYNFDRRNFSKIDKEHVDFYNRLISVQRRNLQQRRTNQSPVRKRPAHEESVVDKSPPNECLVNGQQDKIEQNDKKPTKSTDLVKSQDQRFKDLQELNASLRSNTEQLLHNLEILQAAAPAMPVVRLKRLKTQDCTVKIKKLNPKMNKALRMSLLNSICGEKKDLCNEQMQPQETEKEKRQEKDEKKEQGQLLQDKVIHQKDIQAREVEKQHLQKNEPKKIKKLLKLGKSKEENEKSHNNENQEQQQKKEKLPPLQHEIKNYKQLYKYQKQHQLPQEIKILKRNQKMQKEEKPNSHKKLKLGKQQKKVEMVQPKQAEPNFERNKDKILREDEKRQQHESENKQDKVKQMQENLPKFQDEKTCKRIEGKKESQQQYSQKNTTKSLPLKKQEEESPKNSEEECKQQEKEVQQKKKKHHNNEKQQQEEKKRHRREEEFGQQQEAEEQQKKLNQKNKKEQPKMQKEKNKEQEAENQQMKLKLQQQLKNQKLLRLQQEKKMYEEIKAKLLREEEEHKQLQTAKQQKNVKQHQEKAKSKNEAEQHEQHQQHQKEAKQQKEKKQQKQKKQKRQLQLETEGQRWDEELRECEDIVKRQKKGEKPKKGKHQLQHKLKMKIGNKKRKRISTESQEQNQKEENNQHVQQGKAKHLSIEGNQQKKEEEKLAIKNKQKPKIDNQEQQEKDELDVGKEDHMCIKTGRIVKVKRRKKRHSWAPKKKRRCVPTPVFDEQTLKEELKATPSLEPVQQSTEIQQSVHSKTAVCNISNESSIETTTVERVTVDSEPELCIAAYVTLAVNGECCDETQAKETTLPILDVESTVNKLDIEVATSNVPVYLLNGESRDVPTPITNASDTMPSEEQANREKMRSLEQLSYPANTSTALYLPRNRAISVDVEDISNSLTCSMHPERQTSKRRKTFGGILAQYDRIINPYKKMKHFCCSGDCFNEKSLEYAMPIRLAYVEPLHLPQQPIHTNKSEGERRLRTRRKLNT